MHLHILSLAYLELLHVDCPKVNVVRLQLFKTSLGNKKQNYHATHCVEAVILRGCFGGF